jgi:hypothetical protein
MAYHGPQPTDTTTLIPFLKDAEEHLKFRAVKRSKGMSGKPVTSKPVYGYLMDEDENFIIDKEAAPW